MNKLVCLLITILFSKIIFADSDPIDSRQIEPAETGNWYEKLHWWKKAKPEYEKVSANITQIKKYQKELNDKRVTILPKISDMYTALKLDKNQVISKIDLMLQEISKELDELEIDQEERQKELLDNQKDLQDLKSNLQALSDLENKMDESVLNTLAEQIQLAESYQEKALNSFEQIEDVLDDKKARFLYDTVENANENVKNILDYINGPLRQFINESSAKINELSNIITTKVKELKKRDIILRDLTPEEIEKKAKKKEAQKKEIKLPKEEPLTWWQTIINFIWRIIRLPFDFFINLFR